MQVLDDEHERRISAQLGEGGMDCLEQRDAIHRPLAIWRLGEHSMRRQQTEDRGIGLDQRGSHRRFVERQPTQGLTEGEVRKCALAEIEAVPNQHTPLSRLGLGGELGDEAALSHAGVAAEEHVPGYSSVEAGKFAEPPHLHGPPYEWSQAHVGWHNGNHRGCWC